MNVLISGGSGLIGTALSESLVQDGNQVKILTRNPSTINHLPSEISNVLWDGKSLGEWLSAVEWADAIVNLAGASIAGDTPLQMRWTKKRKELILESRILAGNILSDAIRTAKNPPHTFIQASAIGYYGTENRSKIDENGQPGNDFLAHVCNQWEESSESLNDSPIRRVVIRIGIVLSENGGVYPLFSLPFRLFIGGKLGSGEQVISWIHIQDIVTAITHLLFQDSSIGTYNLTAPHPQSNQDFSKILARALSRPYYLPIPGFALKIILGEVSTLLLDGQNVVPKRLLDEGFTFQHPDLKGAITNIESL